MTEDVQVMGREIAGVANGRGRNGRVFEVSMIHFKIKEVRPQKGRVPKRHHYYLILNTYSISFLY